MSQIQVFVPSKQQKTKNEFEKCARSFDEKKGKGEGTRAYLCCVRKGSLSNFYHLLYVSRFVSSQY